MERGLISIIIPTYNRAHLIGETLSSIQKQTYLEWECIVVDDGSSDNTEEIVNSFIKNDDRFQYYERPISKPKGANACRNYGFEKSKGDFINWFDSDDLMMAENLEKKMQSFDVETDFVIANTLNFDEEGNFSRPYQLNYDLEITPENFIGGKIGWITNDVLIRRSAISLVFNENLHSGQEYNFFSRLLYYTRRGKYVKEDLAKRRIHLGSIQQKLQKVDKTSQHLEAFENECALLNDIKKVASYKTKKRSIIRMIRFSYYLGKKYHFSNLQKRTLKVLLENRMYKPLFNYVLWVITNYFSGKGYFLLRRIK